MTEQEYFERNRKGFEADTIMRDKFAQIIKDYKINLVVELGTYLGGTTKVLSEMCEGVITTEINDEFFLKAYSYLRGIENITMYNEDSLKALPRILSQAEVLSSNALFFIDSHWLGFCPLLGELELIKKSGMKPVIAIHDFFVPNHPELGFDIVNKKRLDWQYVEAHIKAIYGADGFTMEYNSEAEGAKRGIIYLYPKQ